jgi:AhpD family alkylhydroperoxidase
MSDLIQAFQDYREKMNAEILSCGHLGIKRFFALDHDAYQVGALPAKTKELLGLVASTVLRCNDCITYHLIQCHKEKVTDQELQEALNVALIVGGSITIPHLRKAFEVWDELKKKEKESRA